MSWLSNLFGGNEEPIVGIEAETDEQSLQLGIEALDRYAAANGLEETQEKDFYCGLCGWVKISQFTTHSH